VNGDGPPGGARPADPALPPDLLADFARERLTVLSRLRNDAIFCYVLFAVYLAFFHGFKPLIGLTWGALVAIVSFLWLEGIVGNILQPSPQVTPWKRVLRTILRFAFLGVALVVAIAAGFQPLSLLLGFSVVVGAILIEAVGSIFRTEKSAR